MCKTTRYHRKNIPLREHELTGKVYTVVCTKNPFLRNKTVFQGSHVV